MSAERTKRFFDVAIVGGGSSGYAAARSLRNSGLSVVVVEGGEKVGGLCILRGCMPTKALLYAGDVLHLARQAETWGLSVPEVGFDFKQVMARKSALIEEFADYRREQLAAGPFQLIRAQARFIDDHTLSLSNGETLTATHFLISVGSVVASPPMPQLKEVGYLTSDEALSLSTLPKSLIVLGGGAVAVEFAQFFLRFGVKVTLLQRSRHILRDFDEDATAELEKVFRQEGMTVLKDTTLTGAWRKDKLKCVSFQHGGQDVEVVAEEILFALGRTPNTATLGLDSAGVFTDRGRILANTEMQTTQRHIYAAGDCTGPHEIVHIAIQQGEIAAHNIAHPNRKRSHDYRLLTSIVFTDPQVARVGLTEKEAEAKQIPYISATHSFKNHGKSLIMNAKDGFVKLLADPTRGEILGGCVIGPMGGELIHEIIVAMQMRMTVRELAVTPHYHPTLAEIWTYPAEELAEKLPG